MSSGDSATPATSVAKSSHGTEKTSDVYSVDPKLPERFNNPDWFEGYGVKADKQHPMYRTTTASTYGARPPCAHTMPTKFRGKSQKFSEHLGRAGMYRNDSLHTTVDKKYCDKT
ncbi:piercer of microtubule wall 1 protein-like [Sycon ciliatum]|uniref:piercer of microtubule wall 1 protein-like n=1 Tax=Sycon ciliatum TaxID=27933 RepID=UPI0031F70A0E